MTPERERYLERTGEAVTLEEARDNWHYCIEFDFGLTQGEQRNDDGSCAWCGFNGKYLRDDGTCGCPECVTANGKA